MCDAAQQSGGDAGLKIAACIAQLPPEGGRVDACALQGTQYAAQDPLAGSQKNLEIDLCSVTLYASTSWGATSSGSVSLQGTSQNLTTISFTGSTSGLVPQANRWETHNLTIRGNGSSSIYGLTLAGPQKVSSFTCSNTTFAGWWDALYSSGDTISDAFFNCEFNDSYGSSSDGSGGYGIVIKGEGVDFTTTMVFYQGTAQGNEEGGAYVGYAYGVKFYGFLFNDNRHYGAILGAVSGEEARGTSFDGCWFELNGQSTADADLNVVRADHLVAIGTTFTSPDATPILINHTDTGDLETDTFISNRITNGATHPVVIEAGVNQVQFLNNNLRPGWLLDLGSVNTLWLEGGQFMNAPSFPQGIVGNLTQTGSSETRTLVSNGVMDVLQNYSDAGSACIGWKNGSGSLLWKMCDGEWQTEDEWGVGQAGNTDPDIYINSADHVMIHTSTDCGQTLCVNGAAKASAFISPLATPASPTANCTAGQMWADARYIYVCTSTNFVRRVALSSF